MVVEGNNFRDFDDSIFIRWILKSFCGILLVSNVFYIATGIFVFGTDAVNSGLNTLFGTGKFISADVVNSSGFHQALMSAGYRYADNYADYCFCYHHRFVCSVGGNCNCACIKDY